MIFDTYKTKASESNVRKLVREERVFEFQRGGHTGLIVDVETKEVFEIKHIFDYMAPGLAPYQILEN